VGRLVFAVLIAASALVAGSAQAQVGDDAPQMSVSPNWSGYQVSGQPGNPISFSSATGSWTVPTVTCSSNNKGFYSTVWVGIGNSSKMEEVGTDANCDANGKPLYYAWFELVPYIAYNINAKVGPGDAMTGLVKIEPPNKVEVQMQDATRGWTWRRDINLILPDTSTAEWIVEAPAACLRFVCRQASLSNFGAVNMHDVSAVGDGKQGNLNSDGWKVTPFQLVPGQVTVPSIDNVGGGQGHAASPAGATPSAVNPDGSGFSVQWVPVANKGL
jgi:hypothetical protein